MKNGILAFIILPLMLGFSSCRAKKNVRSHAKIKSEIQHIAANHTSQTVADTASMQILAKDSLTQTEYSRKFEFDTIGNIRSISETWRNTGLSKLSTQQHRQRKISLEETKNNTATVETLRTTSQEKTNETNDTRPVQGHEWFWLVLGFGIVLFVVFMIIKKKPFGF